MSRTLRRRILAPLGDLLFRLLDLLRVFLVNHGDLYRRDRTIAPEDVFPEALRPRASVLLLVVVEPVLDRPQIAVVEVSDELALRKVVHRLDAGRKRLVEALCELGVFLSPAVDGVAGEPRFFARERDVGDLPSLFEEFFLLPMLLHRSGQLWPQRPSAAHTCGS